MHLSPTQVYQHIHVELVMKLSLGSIKLYAAMAVSSGTTDFGVRNVNITGF
jgi:hypothetical protein